MNERLRALRSASAGGCRCESGERTTGVVPASVACENGGVAWQEEAEDVEEIEACPRSEERSQRKHTQVRGESDRCDELVGWSANSVTSHPI